MFVLRATTTKYHHKKNADMADVLKIFINEIKKCIAMRLRLRNAHEKYGNDGKL